MSAIIAQIIGVIIILAAMIGGGSLLMFLNIPSILIVLGGTLAATLIRFTPGQFMEAIATSWRAIFPPKEMNALPELIDLTEDILKVTRRNGILAAENVEIDNRFYQETLQMLIDGYSEEAMHAYLQEQQHIFREKAERAAAVFRAMGDAAPAFGMIGTLVGLIQMLANLSDPNSIGPAMAVALLTTLYGAMLANMFALPVADKIESWAESERERMALISDAIHYIQQGEHPTKARQLLSVYLTSKQKSAAKEELEDG